MADAQRRDHSTTVTVAECELDRSELLGPRADLVYQSLLTTLHLPGDVAECGAYEGVTAASMARLVAHLETGKLVHVFDTFSGFPDVVTQEERQTSVWPELEPGKYAADPAKMARILGSAPNVRVYPGRFADVFSTFDRPLCFIHSDSDLHISTLETIELAARILVPGGLILFDDFGNPRLPGVRLAVERALDPELFEGRWLPDSIQFLAVRR
ncbi:MAG: class I SAM-dependent methyltransferase [Pseudonocardiaceae bacterium]